MNKGLKIFITSKKWLQGSGFFGMNALIIRINARALFSHMRESPHHGIDDMITSGIGSSLNNAVIVKFLRRLRQLFFPRPALIQRHSLNTFTIGLCYLLKRRQWITSVIPY